MEQKSTEGGQTCSPEEACQHLRHTQKDPKRDEGLRPKKTLNHLPSPEVEFDLRTLSLEEVLEGLIETDLSFQWGTMPHLKEMSKSLPMLVENPEIICWQLLTSGGFQRPCGSPKEENTKKTEQFHKITSRIRDDRIFSLVFYPANLNHKKPHKTNVQQR